MTDHGNGHGPLRFLFSTSPAYGHFHPLVPLARALKQAGHSVAFVAPITFAPVVEAGGFEFMPGGMDRETDPEFLRLMAQLATMPPGPASERAIFDQVFGDLIPRRTAADLIRIGSWWKPDMFIRESAELGAMVAAEHLGVPYADVMPGAWAKGEALFINGLKKWLDPIRQSWGLAPDPELESLHRYLTIVFAPPGYAIRDLDAPLGYPATLRFVRPQFYDQADRASLPAWVSDLLAQPTVYVTLGTEVINMPGSPYYPSVFQTIIAGLRDEPLNVIITIGREKDPADFGPQPANLHIERYIPQSLLLPHVDLVISHGGSNTLLQTVDAGLPMVMVPLAADQFANASMCRAMRLGRVVELAQLTPDAIQESARDALRNPLYRQNVACLRDEMHALPGLDYAVKLVEEVASACEPVGAATVPQLSTAC